MEKNMTKFVWVIAMLVTTSALAESPYSTPTPDGRQRIQRTGTCPTGYIGKGNFCEAIHRDTPAAMPKIKGAPCPSGTFASGDSCKACSRERPDPRATSGAPTNPLELFLPQVRRGRPARQFLERVSNHLVSHCREIAPFRQARNPGKLQNTVHCNHCTVPAGSGSAAQVSFVALVGGDRELAHMHCSPYSPRLRRPAARDPFC